MAKTKKVSKLKDDSKWAWLMLAPNIIGFLLFMLIPMVATFVLSFTKYDMLSTPKFVGLQNYIGHRQRIRLYGKLQKIRFCIP